MPKARIFTAPECPHSKKLKEFLDEKNIDYEEKCVLENPEMFDEIYKITSQHAIPVTVLNDDFFVGFDRRTERRMKRKLGV